MRNLPLAMIITLSIAALPMAAMAQSEEQHIYNQQSHEIHKDQAVHAQAHESAQYYRDEALRADAAGNPYAAQRARHQMHKAQAAERAAHNDANVHRDVQDQVSR